MASASSLLSEEHFLCSICLDVFTEPVSTTCGHNYCKTCITQYWDARDVCQCPLCNETFDKRPKVSVNTFMSELVHQFRHHKWKEEYEAKTEAEIQQMIRERRLKIQEVKRAVELSRKDANREIADRVQVFTALISCIERSRAELIDVIGGKQKTAEKKAEGIVTELKMEISQLEKRRSELKQLSDTEDRLHLLQDFTSNTPPPTKDWTNVNVRQSSYVGTSVAQLEKTLSREMKRLCDVELRSVQRHAVDVTLDPDTASPWLVLSEDVRQVSHASAKRNLPDSPERFSTCPCVLGKQSFSSGRFYYEVQVEGKSEWDLGVARESVNRKAEITLNPNNGYWSIWLRNGNEHMALTDPDVVALAVREKVQKVGVFVDYEEGLVSFYDVEARVHLYSFTGCTFTEKLHPYFFPGMDTAAPLIIISPVYTSFR